MPGDGSITKLRSARYWARMPVQADGSRPSLGTWPDEATARDVLDKALSITANASRVGLLTFAKFGASVLDLREADGVRSVASERARFRVHLEKSPIASLPLLEITSAHVAELGRALSRKEAADKRGSRKVSRKTVQRCLALVSAVFSEALQRGLVSSNPCVGVKVRKSSTETTVEKSGYLDPEEQHAFSTCEEIPLADRLVARFAWATGLRQGEQWHLELRDLHVTGEDPHVFVRFGSKGKAPKNGKTRRVPLFGDGLAVAQEWLALLPSWCPVNPFGLVFPTRSGCRRGQAKPFGKWDTFSRYLELAGIKKSIRWHDLRHTCASSLVAGWWGHKWTLEEVKEYLGHSSILVTQVYAHLGEGALKDAARKTEASGYKLVTEASKVDLAKAGKLQSFQLGGPTGTRTRDLRIKRAKLISEVPDGYEGSTPEKQELVTSLAERVLLLVKEGRAAEALSLSVTLAGATLAEDPAEEKTRERA